MTDKIHKHIDSAEQRADLLDFCPDVCPECGSEAESGFGLAGGGYGVYTYCPKCEKLLGKVHIDD